MSRAQMFATYMYDRNLIWVPGTGFATVTGIWEKWNGELKRVR